MPTHFFFTDQSEVDFGIALVSDEELHTIEGHTASITEDQIFKRKRTAEKDIV
jgi:hypothetical protein